MFAETTEGVNPLGWLFAESTGGVAPLGWIFPATILIDETLNDYDVVWAAAGHPHAVFPTSYAELIMASGATPMIVGQ